MSARSPYPVTGPKARDELHCWSTALLADDELGAVPALAAPAPSGWTELVDGRGVHVRRRPGPGNAVPVWFIHGLGGASTDWTRLSAALAPWATGYSLDLPGSGRSDPPPGGSYSPVDDAEFAAAVIDQVSGGPVHVVGNSYGAIVATLLAARRPDLVRTLTVISPAVPDLRLTRDRGADARLGLLLMPGTAGLAHQRLASIGPLARARGMGELCFGRPEVISDRDYLISAAEHAWRAGLPWVHSATVSSLRGLMAGYLSRGSASFAASAAAVDVPTLVVWGTRDRLVDVRLSKRAETAYRHGSLLVLAECGHVPQLEDPWTTARGILGLWQQVRPTETAAADGHADQDQVGRAAAVRSARCGNLVA